MFFEKYRGCTTSEKIVFTHETTQTHGVLTEMFTVLCWRALATFPSVHANCWFSGKTRNTKDTYGVVSPLSPGLARAANVPEGTPTCLGYRRSIEREDNGCSSPLPEKHSKKLTDIPASHYAVLNSRGKNKENYCPGPTRSDLVVPQ